jgi:hypothetical protein
MRVGRFALGFGFLCVLLAPACGGIGAGDYAVYRVASRESVISGDCTNEDSTTVLSPASFVLYVAGGESDTPLLDLEGTVLPGEETDEGFNFSGQQIDKETFGGQTIIDSDHDGLDDFGEDDSVDADGDGLDDLLDDDVVDVDGDGLDDRFEDDLVDADGDGEDDNIVDLGGDTLITSISISVSLTIDGQTVAGTTNITSASSCEGTCTGFTGTSCSGASNFIGVELEDAVIDVPN